MSDSLPTAKSSTNPDDRRKAQHLVVKRGLCGLANDTKWDELISAFRKNELWQPRYRVKCIDSQPSGWDREWFHHLPFPLISIEWIDLDFIEKTHRGALLTPTVTDHSHSIETQLKQIGMDYSKGKKLIRIFGYSPKNWDLFE